MDGWRVLYCTLHRESTADGGAYGLSLRLEYSFREDAPPVIDVGDAMMMGGLVLSVEDLMVVGSVKSCEVGLTASGLSYASAMGFLNNWVRERV